MSENNDNPLPRQTLRHMLRFLFSGNFVEIAKIFRRRMLNLIKFFKRVYARLFRFYLNNPHVVRRRDNHRLKKVLAKY
ncbi:MAG TPA: hypothetical protein VG964_03030, partial [Candidatus Saccharimonadales bacterium]|nr:hypothetical protein [Candidatus Saccharimonadales bacterium]